MEALREQLPALATGSDILLAHIFFITTQLFLVRIYNHGVYIFLTIELLFFSCSILLQLYSLGAVLMTVSHI